VIFLPFQALAIIPFYLIINTFPNIGFLAPVRIVDKELATLKVFERQ